MRGRIAGSQPDGRMYLRQRSSNMNQPPQVRHLELDLLCESTFRWIQLSRGVLQMSLPTDQFVVQSFKLSNAVGFTTSGALKCLI